MPPARASAIARRASVTVSIAAEAIGSSSAIERVKRVAVETSFGSTSDSPGTSSTSSKVSPSFANFRGSSVSSSPESCFSNSIRRGYPPWRSSLLERDGGQLGHLDRAVQARREPRIEEAGADLLHRRGTRGDGESERLLDGAAGQLGGEVG